ncbi:AfsR family transcriptional regulator [Kitasatospora sp. MMS16-BH015]|uniref:AfsR/SARP family transcriptional regulator n=1 Tax=Kitasatospora sp. MMS16-BH015 TaxID=2018025 RepID=UPI000CA11013|nr:BTAD domain-containing putative transcriptional regulator [Kitasatospora sp. MMS16-BH015]AUG78771.1 AfsR family transcriptional regulator [Kitasatospora sp. MMS16-BH015]
MTPRRPGEAIARLTVLGPLSLRTARGESPLGPMKQRLVLAMLLCHANSPVTVPALIEALWEGSPPRTARKNLQVYVSTLRHLLTEAGLTDRISLHSSGYQLDLTEQECDLLRFHHLIRAARAAAEHDSPAAVARLLREALDLWQGPPLAELHDSQAVAEEAERLAQRYAPVYEDWAETELSLGHPARVAETVGDLVERHPERERLRAVQMRALSQLGRQTEALAAYEQFRLYLAADFGLAPSPALAAQYGSVLAGAPAAPPTAPAPVAAAHRLPPDQAEFTGRSEELDFLQRSLDPEAGPAQPRLVVLTGPAGVGKTATAVHLAHRLADRYPDGRVLVRLRDDQGRARPLRTVLAELAQAAGRTPPNGRAPYRAGSGSDCTAGHRAWLEHHRVLLVLDDAPGEAQVRPLLPAGGRSAVLVTSRGQLAGLPDARRWSLGPLPAADASRLLGRIIGPDRIAGDPRAAERIIEAVGRLPLALRVCGQKLAVLRHLPLGEYATRLEDGTRVLDELSAGDLAVRPYLGRCWRELPAARRRSLRLLCTLPADGFSLTQAAAALGDAPDTARAELERLMDAGIITPPDHEVTAHALWYELPRLLGAFAREQTTPA